MRPAAVLILLVALLILVPLAAVVELPGEARVKDVLGVGGSSCERVDGSGGDGGWRSERPLRSSRDEPRAVVAGGAVYLAGGLRSDEPPEGRSVARFERFDPRTGRYERLPDMPLPLDHIGMAAVRGDVYVIGGFVATARGLVASPRVFRFSVRARRWKQLPPMRHARGAHGVAVIGSRIYVVGGRPVRQFGRTRNVREVESFDARTQRWRQPTAMPEPREHLGVAAVGDALYAYGGRLPDGSVSARLDRYEPATNTWSRLDDAPLATSGIALVPLGRSLYTGGGEEPHSVRVFGGAAAYNTDARRWISMPNLPEPLHGYAAARLGRRLYLFGGSTCPGFSPTRDVSSSTPLR